MLQIINTVPAYEIREGESIIIVPSVTNTLTLPSPDLQNTLGIRLGTIVHITMSGHLWTYVKRPVPTSMSFVFNYLSIAKRIEADQFFQLIMGKIVNLIDHNGISWRGRVSTGPTNLTDQSRNNSQIAFEFEGYQN